MKMTRNKGMRFESGPNMTPLVDVVMVVLIFLMLAGKFGGNEHYLVSNLPISQSGAGGASVPASGINKTVALDIRVDAPTPDRFIARAGRIETSDPQELEGMLASMKQQFLTADPTITVDDIQVKIGPAKNAKYKHLVQVYEAAMRAKLTKITFAKSH